MVTFSNENEDFSDSDSQEEEFNPEDVTNENSLNQEEQISFDQFEEQNEENASSPTPRFENSE